MRSKCSLAIGQSLLSLAVFSLAITGNGRAQSKGSVAESIVAGRMEDALAELSRLLAKGPKDVGLLRTRMNILLGMRRTGEAIDCARLLVEALPDGLEKTSLRAFSELHMALSAQELQVLIEKAAVYRATRQTEKLLEILKQLKEVRPGNPIIHFSLGEVYGSAGPSLSYAKAQEAFQKFLNLTAKKRFKVDEVFTKVDLTTWMQRLSSRNQGSDIQEIRLTVHAYLDALKEKRCLYLMTPMSKVKKLVSEATKELEKRNRIIKKAEDDIARCEAYLKTPRSRGHNMHNVKWAKIRQCQNRIKREKKRTSVLEDELARLQVVDK